MAAVWNILSLFNEYQGMEDIWTPCIVFLCRQEGGRQHVPAKQLHVSTTKRGITARDGSIPNTHMKPQSSHDIPRCENIRAQQVGSTWLHGSRTNSDIVFRWPTEQCPVTQRACAQSFRPTMPTYTLCLLVVYPNMTHTQTMLHTQYKNILNSIWVPTFSNGPTLKLLQEVL